MAVKNGLAQVVGTNDSLRDLGKTGHAKTAKKGVGENKLAAITPIEGKTGSQRSQISWGWGQLAQTLIQVRVVIRNLDLHLFTQHWRGNHEVCTGAVSGNRHIPDR